MAAVTGGVTRGDVPERLRMGALAARAIGVLLLRQVDVPEGQGVLVVDGVQPPGHLTTARAVVYWLRQVHKHPTGAAAADAIEELLTRDGSLIPIVYVPATGEVVVRYVRRALATVRTGAAR